MPQGEGWFIQFDNAEPVYADLVIAADGAHSKLRKYLTSIQACYSGVTIVEGAVADSAGQCTAIHALLKGGKIFAFGSEKSLIVSSKGHGSLVFYTGCRTDESWVKISGIDFTDRDQVLHWFRQTFTDWSPIWIELFKNAAPAFVPRPQYYMPFDQYWPSQANLTILGDAAHVMPPYAGEGVNMAMLDAVELATCLMDPHYTDLKAAIGTYEDQMRQRTSAVAQLTMHSTEQLHQEGALTWFLNQKNN
ncbi:FAD-dependent oxidoreductase [Siphonobacter sp.]|uniref:FAD-dependent oxidoreductase n=1 Tax=Siphonobacter sp. TaxID=1869184 RepID=UPI003B3B23CC